MSTADSARDVQFGIPGYAGGPRPRDDERPPTVALMRKFGLEPDPWQVEVLEGGHPRLLLNCSRQSGKTTVVSILALAEAIFRPYHRVLILSRSHRQSKIVFEMVKLFLFLTGDRFLKRRTAEEIEFDHLSKIVCLPCNADTIRGYSKVDLVIIDEAARVPDEVYRAVRPMLAVTNGRLICLSTPRGRRGWFWHAWSSGGEDWHRVEIPATKCPRIKPEFLAEERRAHSLSYYRQEYECSFEAEEGLVYPDFARCVVPALPAHVLDVKARDPGPKAACVRRYAWDPQSEAEVLERSSKRVGGLDFGFRNPFAAVWGVIDRDDILWLTGEHYAAERPLTYHAAHLPRGMTWFADPSGAADIDAMIRANFTVARALNDVRLGISAVRARLERDTLRVLAGRCPNLLREAQLHRWAEQGENPIESHNHALSALRYLIATVDQCYLARLKDPPRGDATAGTPERTMRDVLEDERLWRE